MRPKPFAIISVGLCLSACTILQSGYYYAPSAVGGVVLRCYGAGVGAPNELKFEKAGTHFIIKANGGKKKDGIGVIMWAWKDSHSAQHVNWMLPLADWGRLKATDLSAGEKLVIQDIGQSYDGIAHFLSFVVSPAANDFSLALPSIRVGDTTFPKKIITFHKRSGIWAMPLGAGRC